MNWVQRGAGRSKEGWREGKDGMVRSKQKLLCGFQNVMPIVGNTGYFEGTIREQKPADIIIS